MNQQKFTFALSGNRVSVKAGIGFYTKIDLGIVKYHFEAGAGTEHFVWACKLKEKNSTSAGREPAYQRK